MADRAPARPSPSLELEVERAKGGDRSALDSVIRAVQKDVYNLALRFLWHPEDAEDATQEILVRVLAGLGGFRGESGFRTWVYRVACNALLGMRRRRMEEHSLTFEEFGEDLARGLSDEAPGSARPPDEELLLQEVRIGCTTAMLLCLDRPHRLAYILGEILELDHGDASAVLEVAPAAYRKRLSRARAAITALMTARCGLANPANACRCHRRVAAAVAQGRVDPHSLLFASSREQVKKFPLVLAEIRKLDETRRAAALFRSQPRAEPSDAFAAWLRDLLDERRGPS